jgi:hypothetical protein
MPNRRGRFALMKMVLCLAVAPALTAASKCADLSGTYLLQGEDGQVRFSIKQHNCDRMIIVRENNYLGTMTTEKHDLTLDGTEHADTPWLGGRKGGKTTARFLGSQLRVDANVEGDATLTMIYSLTSARDLQIEDLDNRGHDLGSPSVAARQR